MHIHSARAFSVLALFVSALCSNIATAQNTAGKSKIYAQKLVEELLPQHPEVSALELAAISPDNNQCKTIAATEAKEIGEKCDKDELTAMNSNQPFVEKEREKGAVVWDVTMPIHDSAGKVIATVGMDFRPANGLNRTRVIASARQIAKELEIRIESSKQKLFDPVS